MLNFMCMCWSAGIVSTLILVLAVIALVIAFAVESETLFYGPFFLQVLLAVIVVNSLLIGLSFEGSLYNEELSKHRYCTICLLSSQVLYMIECATVSLLVVQ